MADLSTGEKEHHDTRIHSDHALLEYLCLKGAGNEVQGEKAGNVGAEGRAGNEGLKGEQGTKGPVGLRQLLKRRNGR